MTKATGVIAVCAILLVAGVGFIARALKWTWRTVRTKRHGHIEAGQVVGHVEVPSTDGPSFLTLVEFRDSRGELFRIKSRWQHSPGLYEVGRAVRVCYETDDPGGADIVDEIRSMTIWYGALGLLLTALATTFLVGILKYGFTVE